MKNPTTMGKILSTFRYERQEARKKAEEDLWEQNKMSNPKSRGSHEIHESAVHDKDGNTILSLQLWKKVDEKRVKISVNVQANEVKTEEIGNLIDD